MSIMKLSRAVFGGVVLLLLTDAGASSQFRNNRSSNDRRGTSDRPRRRRRARPATNQGDHDDEFHRSLSSTMGGGESSYSSSSALNDNWSIDESSSYSSFYDIDEVNHRRRKKKRKNNTVDETERILLALERGSQEDKEKSKLSKKKRSRKRKGSHISSSPKSSKKKRRQRKQEVFETNIAAAPRTDFVSKASPLNEKQSFVSNDRTAGNLGSSSSTKSAGKKLPQPQLHPDRTKWEVPSYSHKISTMMNNKKNGKHPKFNSRIEPPVAMREASKTTLNSSADSSIHGVGSTSATSNRGQKPTVSATSSQSTTLGSSTTPWVRTFLAGRPKDRLLPLPKDYISDNFNLAQLPPIIERIGYQAMGDNAIPVAKALQQHRLERAASGASQQPSKASSYPIYRRALRKILADPIGGVSEDENDEEDLIIPPYAIQKASESLYLMLHARFIVSPRGLEAIRHVMALDNTVFGRCPRSCCRGTGLLPYGYSNDYTSDASVPTVTIASRKEHDSCCHRYCPSCGEVWISWESKTDGCAWGPSWCHLFLLAFGSQIYAKELEAAATATAAQAPQQSRATPPSAVRSFLPRGIVARGTNNSSDSDRGTTSDDLSRPVPSVFGFKIHPSTAFGRPFNEASLRGGSND